MSQTVATIDHTFATDSGPATHWLLRIGTFACFLGHGACGIMTKASWVPYFGVWGIPEPWAWRLMPIIGTVDILLAVLILFVPIRAVVLWMVFWAFQTACLRPFSGDSAWEFVVRAGNFGVPLAFLWSGGRPDAWRDWFAPIRPVALGARGMTLLAWILRVASAALLVGHGMLVVVLHRPSWAPGFGWIEVALGLAILARPFPALLWIAFAWKLVTEFLPVPAGAPAWEFIEHGASIVAPLALYFVQRGAVSGFRLRALRS